MLNNLKAEMARYGITVPDISRITQKSDKSIRDKITGKSDFSMPEGLAIRNEFFPGLSLEYLFTADEARADPQPRDRAG